MLEKHKIKKRIFFSIIFLIFSFFVVSIPSFANDENIDKIVKENNNISCDTEYLKLLEAVKIKADVANEKENAYNQAINEIKFGVWFVGGILSVIVIIFGFWRNRKLVEAKDEIIIDIENKKKNLEEKYEIDVNKKILDLDKYKFNIEKTQNIAMERIKKEIEGDINDLRSRIKKIENGKIDISEIDEITEDNTEPLKNENNKNENPYD